jgi:uncharacterized protein (TIGR00106 family)
MRYLRRLGKAAEGFRVIPREPARPYQIIHRKESFMLAEISVYPLDKGGSGLSRYVAGSIKIIKDSGLAYEMHALGTLVEGPPDAVFDLIRLLHADMAQHSDRVAMNIKIDDKKGATNLIREKVQSVEEKLSQG